MFGIFKTKETGEIAGKFEELEQFANVVSGRGRAMRLNSLSIAKLERVLARIEYEINHCHGSIAKSEMEIDNNTSNIQKQKKNIVFLDQEAKRVLATIERLRNAVINQ